MHRRWDRVTSISKQDFLKQIHTELNLKRRKRYLRKKHGRSSVKGGKNRVTTA